MTEGRERDSKTEPVWAMDDDRWQPDLDDKLRDLIARQEDRQKVWFANDASHDPMNWMDWGYVVLSAVAIVGGATAFILIVLTPGPLRGHRASLRMVVELAICSLPFLHISGVAMQLGANRMVRPLPVFICLMLTGLLTPLLCSGAIWFGN
jgi:hypothetical protein